MFYDSDITGQALPERTLCLTFDDGPGATPGSGPGPRTVELAEYLHSEGISATFFITGRHGRLYPEILSRLVALGHALGNHGFDHVNLPTLIRRGGNPVKQVARAAEVLAPWVRGQMIPFRPPYGAWREEGATNSTVAACLNASSLASTHVGPVHWDVAPADWWFWKNNLSLCECLDAYCCDIDRSERGIVLFHDSTADDDLLRSRNQTYELVRRLIPRLKAAEYRFAPLVTLPLLRGASLLRLLPEPIGLNRV